MPLKQENKMYDGRAVYSPLPTYILGLNIVSLWLMIHLCPFLFCLVI